MTFRPALFLILISACVADEPTRSYPADPMTGEFRAEVAHNRKNAAAKFQLLEDIDRFEIHAGTVVLHFLPNPGALPIAAHPLAPGPVLRGQEIVLQRRGDLFHIRGNRFMCTYLFRLVEDGSVFFSYEWEEPDSTTLASLIDRGDFVITKDAFDRSQKQRAGLKLPGASSAPNQALLESTTPAADVAHL